jgi:hypothetical protein
MPSEERENLRGHVRMKLLHDLASGELSYTKLAAKYTRERPGSAMPWSPPI